MNRQRIILPVSLASFWWNTGYAALNDNIFTQRVAVTRSAGDLSKNPGHLSLQSTFSKTFLHKDFIGGMDAYHEVGVFFDSFKTRGYKRLLFPFAPESTANVIEPSISLGLCAFSLTSFQVCSNAGVSISRIQTTIKNYQTYGAAPAQMRFVWRPVQSSWIIEFGVRYRVLRSRIDGFTSSHQDISYSLGVGFVSNGR